MCLQNGVPLYSSVYALMKLKCDDDNKDAEKMNSLQYEGLFH